MFHFVIGCAVIAAVWFRLILPEWRARCERKALKRRSERERGAPIDLLLLPSQFVAGLPIGWYISCYLGASCLFLLALVYVR